MIIKDIIFESTPKTLYHGTIVKNLPSIMKYGIEPKIGKFTSNVYKDYIKAGIDLPYLTFAADRNNLKKVISSILGAMSNENIELNLNNFLENAAIVVFKKAEKRFQYRSPNDLTHMHPNVEPEDYYSEMNMIADYALTGKKLLKFLQKNNIDINVFL
jgi:hypothetical protein